MCAAPLGCIASASTRPLNRVLSDGLRTTSRVLYGCPFAVPETQYSFTSYLNSLTLLPGANDGAESNIGPGPVTSDNVGSATAVGCAGRLAGGACWPCPRPPPCSRPAPCPGPSPWPRPSPWPSNTCGVRRPNATSTARSMRVNVMAFYLVREMDGNGAPDRMWRQRYNKPSLP